jgi:hypothetical protein
MNTVWKWNAPHMNKHDINERFYQVLGNDLENSARGLDNTMKSTGSSCEKLIRACSTLGLVHLSHPASTSVSSFSLLTKRLAWIRTRMVDSDSAFFWRFADIIHDISSTSDRSNILPLLIRHLYAFISRIFSHVVTRRHRRVAPFNHSRGQMASGFHN